MNQKSFGKRLKLARNAKGLTAEQLSEKIDLTDKSIWQIESGERGTTLSNLVAICNTLDVSPEYLLDADLTCASGSNIELIDLLSDMSAKDIEILTALIKTYITTKS